MMPDARPALPLSLTGPCPPWCAYVHDHAEWAAEDRVHRGADYDVTLTSVDAIVNIGGGKLWGIEPRRVSACLWQQCREAEPRVNVSHGEEADAVMYLTLDEAEQHARHLLALVAAARREP